MRHLKTWIFLLLAICLLNSLGHFPLRAQDNEPPLIIYASASYLSYDGDTHTLAFLPGLEEISHFTPYMAPNNHHLAFKTVAQNENFVGMSGPFPTSIYIYDLETGQAEIISTQPADAAHNSERINSISRSRPAWSPDGQYLVWGELQMTQATLDEAIDALAIYNMLEATTYVVELDLPPQYGIASPLIVSAGRDAIAIITSRYDETASDTIAQILFYDYAGNHLRTIEPFSNTEYASLDSRANTWVQHGADDYFAIGFQNASWTLLSSDEDDFRVYWGHLELRNPLVPDGYAIMAHFSPAQSDNNTSIQRIIGTGLSPDGVEFDLRDASVLSLDQFAVAPDGGAVAYLNREHEIFIATEDSLTRIAENYYPVDIAWVYGVWYLPDNAELIAQ